MLKLFKKKRVRDYLKDEEFLKEYDQIRSNSETPEIKEETATPAAAPEIKTEAIKTSVITAELDKKVIEETPVVTATEQTEPIPIVENETETNAAATLDIDISESEESIKTETISLDSEAALPEIHMSKIDIEIPPLEEPVVEEEEKEEDIVPEKKNLFNSLSVSLAKTKDKIFGKLNRIISANSKIDEDTLDELEEALYTSDIGVKMTELIINNIRQRVKTEKYENSSELITLIHEEIEKLVKTDDNLAKADFKVKPYVILVVGVNGNGKTTTIGKLSNYYKNMGKKVLIAAADTFRAAAIEQLEEWANRSGADFVKQQMNSDPAAVAYNAYQAALSRGSDVVLIDTAGRLHNKVNLMKELEKITRVLKKLNPDAPHESLLVLDATTGQNAVSQAKAFNITSDITGLVLTKLDGTAKGGIAIAINQELDLPVKFIGVGEKIDDLQIFNVKDYVKAIFS